MTTPITRRRFLQTSAAATFLAGAPAYVRGRDLNSKIDVAVVACGGRGGANMREVSKSEYITALCDVNADAVDKAKAIHKEARGFTDFRKLFDDGKGFDAVVVSTCEHTHAFATMRALALNKHVYCEKPLTHNIWEARKVREEAAKRKVTTQMGIQMHATDTYRRAVEIIQGNIIGPVKEVHVWVSRAWGLQSKEASDRNRDIVYVTERPKEADPIPKGLDWDLWLGPAPERPFNNVYWPGPKWYRWWDFGNGTMSDLGSHRNDLPFWALKLQAPLTVEANSEVSPHPEIAPASMTAVYEYGPRGDLPPVKLTWYQGEPKPKAWTDGTIPRDKDKKGRWGDGILFVGEKGMLLVDYGRWVLLPEEKFRGVKLPEPTLPRPASHYAEWLEACKTGKQSSANFEYSGWLTEANHLGNVAYRAGKKLEWDPVKLRATNAPEADKFIRREYRKGWVL
ncbi:MAG TPA: Gfo/Idh/MocA family oxidoreductase [Gemmataceae bacterium]|nr:Gfo/Idh/MocA family oxidoreductase [Gemmataceae bacterium]